MGENRGMGFTPAYRALVEERLSAVVPVQTKAMFGGVGIYTEGLFFALIAEDRLYLKVDDSNRGDFEAAGMSAFYPYDSPKPMHYWELPAGVLDDPKELAVWVDKSVRVAERAKK
jgi:DNA transformation protein